MIDVDKDNVWKKISDYIKLMNTYYTSNKLKINTGKTHIMIVDKNNKTVHGSLLLNNNIVKNQHCIKILGTWLSVDMKFNINYGIGSNCLKTQLKRRSSAIKRISHTFSLKFRIQLINSLLLGKIQYNLPIWGYMSVKNQNSINNIFINTVKYINRDDFFGRTDKWLLEKCNIMNFFTY